MVGLGVSCIKLFSCFLSLCFSNFHSSFIFAGIGASSRYGILIKGSNYLEKLNQANIFVFDKTGTLTKGNFVVTKITPIERKEEILSLAAIAEQNSNHPIAKSIINAYHQDLENDYILTNIAGQGIMAKKGIKLFFVVMKS